MPGTSGGTVQSIEPEKTWAAIRGDTVLAQAETKQKLMEKIEEEGIERPYEIRAMPKKNRNLFI